MFLRFVCGCCCWDGGGDGVRILFCESGGGFYDDLEWWVVRVLGERCVWKGVFRWWIWEDIIWRIMCGFG